MLALVLPACYCMAKLFLYRYWKDRKKNPAEPSIQKGRGLTVDRGFPDSH